jgi:hypothetical protein
MNEVVKHLLLLVKVAGQAKASPSVAQGSAATYKDDINEALLSQLKHGKLVELYGESVSWGSHIQSWLLIISPS